MTINTYVCSLKNKIFKILPLREQDNDFLEEYLKSLQIEIIGAFEIFSQLQLLQEYIAIMNTIQYLSSHDFDVKTCKREVFKMLALAEKIRHSIGGE